MSRRLRVSVSSAASSSLKLRPLEREDLQFVHTLDNDAAIMRYWFEEPYEAFVELVDLYDKHIHDQMERRFIVDHEGESIGLVELIEVDYIHRRGEFQIIIGTEHQGKGFGERATRMALDYAFQVLNLYKVYLVVDVENKKAIHMYEKTGFTAEGILRQEFFVNGVYRDVMRMSIFQPAYLAQALQR